LLRGLEVGFQIQGTNRMQCKHNHSSVNSNSSVSSDSSTLESGVPIVARAAVARQRSAPDTSRRQARRVPDFDSRASILVSDSVDVESALHVPAAELRQSYAVFVDQLHRRCFAAGQDRVLVQHFLRKQLHCTFASWVLLSQREVDTL